MSKHGWGLVSPAVHLKSVLLPSGSKQAGPPASFSCSLLSQHCWTHGRPCDSSSGITLPHDVRQVARPPLLYLLSETPKEDLSGFYHGPLLRLSANLSLIQSRKKRGFLWKSAGESFLCLRCFQSHFLLGKSQLVNGLFVPKKLYVERKQNHILDSCQGHNHPGKQFAWLLSSLQ